MVIQGRRAAGGDGEAGAVAGEDGLALRLGRDGRRRVDGQDGVGAGDGAEGVADHDRIIAGIRGLHVAFGVAAANRAADVRAVEAPLVIKGRGAGGHYVKGDGCSRIDGLTQRLRNDCGRAEGREGR